MESMCIAVVEKESNVREQTEPSISPQRIATAIANTLIQVVIDVGHMHRWYSKGCDSSSRGHQGDAVVLESHGGI